MEEKQEKEEKKEEGKEKKEEEERKEKEAARQQTSLSRILNPPGEPRLLLQPLPHTPHAHQPSSTPQGLLCVIRNVTRYKGPGESWYFNLPTTTGGFSIPASWLASRL